MNEPNEHFIDGAMVFRGDGQFMRDLIAEAPDFQGTGAAPPPTAREKYQALRGQMNALLEQIKNTGGDAFKDMSAELFEAHPLLDGFRWRQYTPYFNDGDECTFSARTSDPECAFTDTQDSDDGYDYDGWTETNTRAIERKVELGESLTPREAAALAVAEFLAIFDDSDLKALFGDHVMVTVSREGVTTRAYSHD